MTSTMRHLASAVAVLWVLQSGISADSETLVTKDAAFVRRDKARNTWTIGNDHLALTVGFDADGEYRLFSLQDSAGHDWDLGSRPDGFLIVEGAELPLGSRDAGFALRLADPVVTDTAIRFSLTFELKRFQLSVERTYVIHPQTPVIETWTRIEAAEGAEPVNLSDLNTLDLSVPASTLRYLNGLQAPDDAGGSFALKRRDLEDGNEVTLAAHSRSTEQFLPWMSLVAPEGEFFGGLMWSGAWTGTAGRDADRIRMRMGLTGMTTVVTHEQPVETPHGFFGAVPGGMAEESAALHEFIMRGVRQGRPFEPAVIYNTWFVYGVGIDEKIAREEIEQNARRGAEVFVLDAGWYAGAARHTFDFTSGLGSWDVDPSRFPGGLAPIANYARSLGLKFGVWVEPGRIDLDLVGRPGLAPEGWLVKDHGKYEPGMPESEMRTGQLCLANPVAQQYLIDHLVRFIEEVRPDYLKWDNNRWVNCDRPDHGHGPQDGNFRQVQGLYQVLSALRQRFPGLTIENVSGGGNRLDFAMLRYSDVGWMDDRSAPSRHVRHNLEGLISVFPPAYLFSFVMGHAQERLDDVPLVARSRMPGVLGLSLREGEITNGAEAELADEIKVYKGLREILRDAHATMLTPQLAESDLSAWDAIQAISSVTGDSLIYVFAGPEAPYSTLLRPVQLNADATYEVSSIDRGVLGRASGAALMADGIEVAGGPHTAEILRLRQIIG